MSYGALRYLHARYDEEAAAAIEARELARIHTNGAEAAEVTVTLTWQWHLQAAYSNQGYGTSIVPGAPTPHAVLDDLQVKRMILDLHEQELTVDSYRQRLGAEPPTGRIIRALLQPYAARGDFDQAWGQA
jgi:hypothetical protein